MKKTYAIRIFGYNLLNLFKSFFWKGFFVVPFFRAIQFLRPNATELIVYTNNIIPITLRPCKIADRYKSNE